MTTATAESTGQATTETGTETLLTGTETQPAAGAEKGKDGSAIAQSDGVATGTAETKTAEQVAAEKAAADKAAAEAVPDRYDLTVPKESLLQPADVERIKADAKAMGLTQAEAQEYFDTQSKAVASFHEAQVKQVDEIHKSWRQQAEQDKEIGGQAFRTNVELGKRVIDRFGTPEFRQVLIASGLGNHPEIIRTFVRIGQVMSEDQFVHAGVIAKAKTAEEVFYGSSTETTKG